MSLHRAGFRSYHRLPTRENRITDSPLPNGINNQIMTPTRGDTSTRLVLHRGAADSKHRIFPQQGQQFWTVDSRLYLPQEASRQALGLSHNPKPLQETKYGGHLKG